MTTTKTYPVEVALSVASGRLLCEFPQLHEAVTDLAGWPVFTHHMASEELTSAVADKVIRQVPWMPGAIENMPTWTDVPRDERLTAIEDWLVRIREVHGSTVAIDLGEPTPPMAVLDGLEQLGQNR
jgi:hypothetical protein